MAITAIKSVKNSVDNLFYVKNVENPNDTGGIGHALEVPPGQTIVCNMWIPWCDTQDQFDHGSSLGKGPAHILISFLWSSTQGGPIPPQFAIWQQGDYVRYSRNALFKRDGDLVMGNNTVGGDRSVEVTGSDMQSAQLWFY